MQKRTKLGVSGLSVGLALLGLGWHASSMATPRPQDTSATRGTYDSGDILDEAFARAFADAQARQDVKRFVELLELRSMTNANR